jgi:hypothetical protein
MKNEWKVHTVLMQWALVTALAVGSTAHAATAYYVSATDIYARAAPQSYAMGRLYTNERMDIQYVDSNGWAYGFAYGSVQRCVWMQYSEGSTVRFWTHGTGVSDKCRNTDRYLHPWEFNNGEVWSTPSGTDGVMIQIARDTHMWDNWVWGGAWGNHNYRGVSPAGSFWRIRYTTYDGGGVMARPCTPQGTCYSDWLFIQRSAF